MRNRIEELEARNAQLEAQVERMQLNFSFDKDTVGLADENEKLNQDLIIANNKLIEQEKTSDELANRLLSLAQEKEKDKKQLKSVIEAYQNTIARLTSQNAKDYSQNPSSREKMTSESFMLCGA